MMHPLRNDLLTTSFSACVLLTLLLGSCGLRYEPQTPPENKQLQRQKAIESKIESEFAERKMTYKSIAFGKTVTIKPASFIKLDSLFEQKYQLEQSGRKDRDLEEKIGVQRLICQTDTNEILYMEEHVFSLTNDSVSEVLSGNFSLNARNEIRNVEFTQSYTIPADLVPFYTHYVLNESFIFSSAEPSEEEADFYDLYKTQAAALFGSQKEAFVVHTLKLMKIARTKRSLEKQMFLKELTMEALNSRQAKEQAFTRIDQVSKANDMIDYYIVEYHYAMKKDLGMINEKYVLKFDPYLMLISKELVQ